MPRTLVGCKDEGRGGQVRRSATAGSGRKTGEEERHGRLWEEGRQSRRNPGGCIPTKGCVHEYGTVSPAATWFSTWRGTAPVK